MWKIAESNKVNLVRTLFMLCPQQPKLLADKQVKQKNKKIMKRFLVIITILFLCVNFVTAQEKKHKLPDDYAQCVKNTWSLGFQAMIYNRNDIEFQSGLYAKYLITDKFALRGNLRFGRDWAKGTNPKYIPNQSGSNDDNYTDENDLSSTTIRKSNFMLVFGAEHRHKLSNRFFGYYGLDLGAGGYGQLRRSYDKSGNLSETIKQNRSFDLTLQPFLGLELFVGPKISFALETGYDILFKFYNKSLYTKATAATTEKINQYTSLASHIDFGNCVFGTAKIAFYF